MPNKMIGTLAVLLTLALGGLLCAGPASARIPPDRVDSVVGPAQPATVVTTSPGWWTYAVVAFVALLVGMALTAALSHKRSAPRRVRTA